ncbi:hypothetical protein AVEN_190919-1 [Araneus ventricosus]|uniref:Uncharacterized protein n=1 Tax=Araneus ventricosus TaxID=182803 RepID=A0A4Y2CSQ9_ARAVE|nr:hypothetical protein AVEN_190919-1 [Araneus ventricosus]
MERFTSALHQKRRDSQVPYTRNGEIHKCLTLPNIMMENVCRSVAMMVPWRKSHPELSKQKEMAMYTLYRITDVTLMKTSITYFKDA